LSGPYSLNGYRVRVYRQDSATQWFTGIITHHNLFSRNMVVMNDQVLEPQNVDPSMIQMTFLDDVVHSLLKGENIGITSRRRSRSSQNNNTAHSHYTRAQANSPRPVMTSSGTNLKEQRSSRSSKRKGSDSSVPEEDKDKSDETIGRGEDNSKSKVKQAMSKRRKGEEDEKKAGLKRLKTDMTSDLSESSDSENPNNKGTPNSENELKTRSSDVKSSGVSKTEEDEKLLFQVTKRNDSSTLIGRLSPWVELQAVEDSKKGVVKETGKMITKEEEDLVAVTHITQSPQQQMALDTVQGGIIESSKHTMKGLSPDLAKSRMSPSPNPAHLESLKQKLQPPSNSQCHSYTNTNPADLFKTKSHPGQRDNSIPKPNTSPEVSKHKIPRYSDTSPPPTGPLSTKVEVTESLRSGFKPVPVRSEPGGVNANSSSTKSPLIIDKNETFTVYRDPALVRSDTENAASATVSSNHVAAYLHPHLHTLHSASPHSPCLTPAPHPHAASHLLAPPHTSALPHPHLLPPGVLPAMPPPAASLLGGHPRLDSPSGLGHLALPHPAAAHQQQFLQAPPPPPLLTQAHSGATGLSLYPILWQYPNGTPTSYPPGLNLPPTSKWVHPENPVPVNSEASLRRNTASPWLHQAAGSAGDSLGLLSHVPVRPASADAHRPTIKINTHTSPPLSKASVDIHKEDEDKKGFVDPIKTLTMAQLKQDQTNRSQTPTGKDISLHRLYLDPHSKARLANTQDGVPATDRTSKYKEENRQILKESIEVAPFTAKIQRTSDLGMDRDRERCRDPAFPVRIPALASSSSKAGHTHPHVIQAEKSNYFTTLSNSVVNEPPRLYPSKELSSYYEKVSAGALSLGSYSSKASLSKPPPLIKHQPEGGEGLAGKITEQLSQQVTLQQQHQLRAMPSLHRAPVFHPPTQHALERKEAKKKVIPVSLASAGNTKLAEQQKPPTLLPELRDVKGHGNTAVVTSVAISGDTITLSAEGWRGAEIIQERGVSFSGDNVVSRGKPQSAMASVIVRPSTSVKCDTPIDANKSGTMVHKEFPQGRFYPSNPQMECPRLGESVKQPASRIIQPSSNLDEMSVQYKKTSLRGLQGTMGASSIDSVCRTVNSDASTFGTQIKNELGHSISARGEISAHITGSSGWVLSHSGPREHQEGLDSCIVSSGGSLPPPSPAGTPQPSPCLTPTPSTICGSSQPYSFSFVHLKKHKAALAAAQYRNNISTAPTSISTGNSSFSSPLPNGHTSWSASTSSGQPSNYHKLKKAWLTRHSEEDKNTTSTNSSTSAKPDKMHSTTFTSTKNATAMSEMIKPCTVNLSASTSNEVELTAPLSRRGSKRPYESCSESGGDDSDASESRIEGRAKRQPKPTYKKKQNDMAKKKGDNEKEEDDVKPNGIFRSAREKTKLKLASSNGIPRSILKDWRKVKKLKQTGESFLQDDSCSEIGPNLQKCRECRVVRSKKGEEPAHSPVFCRFYYFRRLSYSKNGVIRMDGFSTPDQFDDEALALWDPGVMQESHLDQTTAKYILSFIGDNFCQMVVTENTAATWVKKDAKLAWKRAVRGVREMCDACEATLFNIHWVCQKCGFVVCLDCYKAKERRSSKDKELYSWLKCVKGQLHDHKHLMPTQVIPGTVLTELMTSMHSLREKHKIKSHCPCTNKQNLLNKLPATNGVSQVLQNVLNHSNKLTLVKAELGSQQNSDQGGTKVETNGGGGGGSSSGSDAGSAPVTPPESQSPLHFLADLAEQKSREEKKENKESVLLGKSLKEEKEGDSLEVLQQCKTTSLMANSAEQGSTLRDLLTTTAGKLKLGSTDAGIAFAPVYSTPGKGGRTMPNILDDIIASVVENKIPSNRKKSAPVPAEVPEESINQCPEISHCWLNSKRLLWLKDHRNQNNWKLFRESWKQGQPVLVSGIHKRLNASLWKADSFNQEFADHQGDLLNCKDQVVSNSGIKEFWDGFEDITKRPKSKDGEPMVYRLKDWPSGEEFMALIYDDLMKNLPLPEYSDPEGNLNLASHLPSFFVRPDLGPRLCCAYGVAASQDQDFGTANLHVEVSDVVSVLVYVGVAKGNGVLSKTGVLKRLEEEDLDEGVRRRLKDSSETPGALWHIYLNKDMDKIREFLHKLYKERGLDFSLDQDPVRQQSLYLSRKQRQRLLDEQGVEGWTVVQFLGDSVLIPAGAMHQVQNLHSCVQVINDFVSPEHVAKSFHLTQELRPSKEVNYEDKLQVKNILYHCVKEVVSALNRASSEDNMEEKS
uniref:Probable JmjC domain-containing histone demethylation protein 2C n=1 Tax=Mola mola TaxID=94237 RepID=A0A3Q3VYN8_MOLML